MTLAEEWLRSVTPQHVGLGVGEKAEEGVGGVSRSEGEGGGGGVSRSEGGGGVGEELREDSKEEKEESRDTPKKTDTESHAGHYYYICVRIHITITMHVSAYEENICVRILLYMCPHTTVHVSAYYCTCVRILLYMCPHTPTHVSAYY